MSSMQVLKLEDAEGSTLLVTRIEDVGYALVVSAVTDENGNPLPFRLLDEDDRKRLRDFLRALA